MREKERESNTIDREKERECVCDTLRVREMRRRINRTKPIISFHRLMEWIG